MQIQNTLLRAQCRNLQKQNAFLKLKIKMLEDRKLPSEITLVNKQLYLDYMEEVLTYKEKQLLEAQKKVQLKALELINEQSYLKLLNPLENSTDIDIFLKKIEEVKALVITNEFQNSSFQLQQWKDFMKRQAEIVEDCRNYQRQTQNLIKTEYQNLIRQRKILAESMDKFEELHSYEKYLNELQIVLEAKQHQVLTKEDELFRFQQNSALSGPPHCLSFARETHSVKQPNQKKRLKIFESANKSQDHKFFQQYESDNSSANQRFSNISHANFMPKDESSFIMQESQTKRNESVIKCQQCLARQFETSQTKQTLDTSVQVQIQFPNETLERLQKQKKILKFARLWLKFSIDTNKTVSHISKKTIGFYLWKLNTVMDSKIPDHLKETYNWPVKYEQSLKDHQLFPYAQLSLNRKKYAQLSLSWERKILYQTKIKNALKNIIKTKNFKERIIFACYFKKYLENSKLKAINEWERAISNGNKMSGKDTTIMEPNSRYHTESNLVSVHSSRIMNEYRPLHENNHGYKENRRSKGTLNGKSMSSINILAFSQQKSKTGKENLASSESLDAKKLKDYIKTHEEAEKMLATQCIKTEALCKLGQTLIGCLNRPLIHGFYMIRQRQENERIIDLEKRITKYEFKWELFTTKCKLALVNNNNKISHLEETLGFMFSK